MREPISFPRPAPTITPATDLTGVLVLKHRDLMLLTDAFGDIHPDSRGLGLYWGDTRVLSRYELRLNGERPVVLRTGVGGGYHGTLQLTNPDLLRHPDAGGGPGATLRRQSLGVRRERVVANVFHERISVRNYTLEEATCRLSVVLDADDADIFEVRGLQRPQHGEWLPVTLDGQRALFRYLGRDGVLRRTHVAFSQPYAVADGPVLLFDWHLAAGAQRSIEVTAWPEEAPGRATARAARRGRTEPAAGEATESAAPEGATDATARRAAAESATEIAMDSAAAGLRDLQVPVPAVERSGPAEAHRAWTVGSTRFVAGEAFVQQALDRALVDLRLLVNEGPDPGERYVSAGVPWFAVLFGRDALITAYELLPVRPDNAADTLKVLARLQATADDPARDAEPGKILHELRSGELARTGEIPHTPYYGSVDATPLWLILLGEAYRWTADRGLVEQLWPNALAALGWLDAACAQRPDGFLAYQRRSAGGLVSQGWKDSPDSVRFRDGRLAEGLIALAEVQGYVYAARRAVAQLARTIGDDSLADAQECRARELRERFEAAFWMEGVGTYAMALDGQGRQADAVSSNAGQVLFSGIASPERAARVAASLVEPGLWSGWGIRTLSTEMAGYNPIGYHTGSVWPHDNALIAAGLTRYGHHELASRVAGAMLEAARYFRDSRLPECFCGFARNDAPYPVPYPVACSPQAWAAGSPFLFVATLLGLSPDAAAGRLELFHPYLPPWLPGVRLEGLRVGEATVDLLVRGSGTSVAIEVPERRGNLDVVVRM